MIFIKDRKYLHRIMILLVALFIVFSSNTVFADNGRSEVDSVKFVGKNHGEISRICSQANGVAGSNILIYTGNDGIISFSNEEYSKLTIDVRREFMETALLATKESGLGTKVKSNTYNFIANQDSSTSAAMRYLKSDASADFASAAAWFKPFSGFFGTVLGLLSLAIFMCLALSIVVDCAYIVIPGWRVIVSKNDHERPRFISREAYHSVVEAESAVDEGYKSAMSLYMSRRVKVIVLMCLALGYLVSGQIYNFMAWLIDSFSWIFEF